MKINFVHYALWFGLAVSVQALADDTPGATLDSLHKTGAQADRPAFFSLLANDAVFLGMAGSDRLEGQQVRDFFSDRFANGAPWSFQSSQRDVQLSADGNVAWFDEALTNVQGEGRGSGVLIRAPSGWKIAQYNLTFPASQNNSSAATSTTSGAVAAEAPQEKACSKLRHKTNKVSNC